MDIKEFLFKKDNQNKNGYKISDYQACSLLCKGLKNRQHSSLCQCKGRIK